MIKNTWGISLYPKDNVDEEKNNYYIECRERGIPCVLLSVENHKAKIEWDCNPLFEYSACLGTYFEEYNKEICNQISYVSSSFCESKISCSWSGEVSTKLTGGANLALKIYNIFLLTIEDCKKKYSEEEFAQKGNENFYVQ